VAQILCGGTVGLAHANSPHAHGQPVSVAGLYLIMSCPGDSGDIRWGCRGSRRRSWSTQTAAGRRFRCRSRTGTCSATAAMQR